MRLQQRDGCEDGAHDIHVSVDGGRPMTLTAYGVSTPPQYPSALERSDVEHRTTSRAAGEPQRAPTQRFVVFTGAERCRRVLPSR
jgi:hypothetical protein